MDSLENFREIIDECDETIVKALEKRFDTVLDVLEYKRDNGLGILQAQREKVVLEKINSYLKNKAYSGELALLYDLILKTSRKIQSKKLFPYNIVLIGFMGCGKSAVGKELSKLLEMDYIDTDDLIVKNSGLYISEIFNDYGEVGFRKLEKDTVYSLLDRENSIISCGGGAVLDPSNVETLKYNGKLIWLKATPETLYKRLVGTTNRPLLQNNVTIERLEELLSARVNHYEKAADFKIDTDNKDIVSIGQEIIKALLNDKTMAKN